MARRRCGHAGELKEKPLSANPCSLRPELPGLEEQLPALRRYARKLVRNPDDAADIVQMCLERALRNSGMFEPGTNLRAWLFTILHHEFITDIRRRARQGQAVPLDEWVVPGRDGEQERALHLQEFVRAFSKLAPKDRQILQIIGLDGNSYADAGIYLKIEIGTVKSRMSRARERLRVLMGDSEAPVPAAARRPKAHGSCKIAGRRQSRTVRPGPHPPAGAP